MGSMGRGEQPAEIGPVVRMYARRGPFRLKHWLLSQGGTGLPRVAKMTTGQEIS